MMHYTDCEVAFLEANYRRMGAAWCAEKLGRTVTAIYMKAHQMDLPAGSRWTPEECEFIEAHYPEIGEQWCADKLGRTRNAVRNKAFYLNIKRSCYWSDEDKAALVELNAQGWQDYRIAKHLGKTTESVRNMRYRLGVTK